MVFLNQFLIQSQDFQLRKNSKDVANKILSLFEDESKIKRMGENALIRARKHFTWEKKLKKCMKR